MQYAEYRIVKGLRKVCDRFVKGLQKHCRSIHFVENVFKSCKCQIFFVPLHRNLNVRTNESITD